MKGSAEFLIGAKDHGSSESEEAFMTAYHNTFDLNTSFTGEDKLKSLIDMRIKIKKIKN